MSRQDVGAILIPASHVTMPPLDVLAFASGLLAFIEVQIIGRLYLGEVILLLYAASFPLFMQRLHRRERRWLTWFLLLGIVYFVGLIATDLYRETPFRDYARGWARAFIYLTDFTGLLVLSRGRITRLALFVTGTALSQVGLVALGGWSLDWKFGLAYPVTVAALVAVDARRPLFSLFLLGSLGALHLMLDFRIYAGICVVVGILAYLRGSLIHLASLWKFAMVGSMLVAFGLLYMAGAGWTQTGAERLLRQRGSNVERAAGFLVAANAIRQSPIIGYGSWARNEEALDTWAQLRAEAGSSGTAEAIQQGALLSPEGATIRAHSMLLQAWVEAGVLGLLFFGFQFTAAGVLLYRVIGMTGEHRYFALVCFFGLWSVWAFLMSPFSGISRLYAGMSLSLLLVASLTYSPYYGRPISSQT